MKSQRLIPFSDFCQVGSGTTPSRGQATRYFGGGIPWVKSGELRETEIVETEETVTKEALAQTSLRIIPRGALLVAMYGATVGRVGLLGVPATTNQAVCHLIPDPSRAHTKYIFHLLCHLAPHFVSRGAGGAQPNINQGVIRDFKVHLPTLDEQRRIAAMLDQVDALRRKRARSIKRLSDLAETIFYDLFGDLLTNSKSWSSGKRLGELSEIVSGITKGRQPDGETRPVPYMAVLNVQDKRLDLDTVKIIEATRGEVSRYRLAKDDLLLTEGGDPDKLGRGTLWNDELPEAIHQNHIFRVRVASKEIDPVFLNWLIGSPYGKAYFLRSAKQTTGIASINMSQLRAFPMLLPPIALQREFRRRLDHHRRMAESMHLHRGRLSDLFASLQQRAFSGELTSAASATEMRKLASAE